MVTNNNLEIRKLGFVIIAHLFNNYVEEAAKHSHRFELGQFNILLQYGRRFGMWM